ncbi:uncharacterized protein P884DRAFT_288751 [Thermothelomyces heterothallicus CBS 202.75]|uniref:uncharacterized protein n=1 Tax=Thermothelomyces heterothallicus CBS 202.75 TaxID=1149848 RepID=UPI0037429C7C
MPKIYPTDLVEGTLLTWPEYFVFNGAWGKIFIQDIDLGEGDMHAVGHPGPAKLSFGKQGFHAGSTDYSVATPLPLRRSRLSASRSASPYWLGPGPRGVRTTYEVRPQPSQTGQDWAKIGERPIKIDYAVLQHGARLGLARTSTRLPQPSSGRKGSGKVPTGCITCKIRKVKCDEAKPFCMRCTETGRRCDGYLDAKTMAQRRRRSGGPGTGIVGEPQAPLALFHDWASSDERRAFHFFQHITAPCLSRSLDGPFWRFLVPMRHSQPHPRQPSPPELQELFLSLSVFGHEPPVADMPNAAFTTGQGAASNGMSSWALFDSFEAAQPAVTSSCSSSVAGSAEMGTMGDMAGHMPIDPPLFLDPIELSTAPTFSVRPSTASSLDDPALPPASTPYTGPSASQSRHTSRSRGSPSVASGGSTPAHSTGMERTTVPAAGSGGLLSQFQEYRQQHHHQQQQYLGGGLPMSVGQLSPKTRKRSGDAPYDVPERYRVHESIIWPDKEDGTSRLMLFRKLGGLHAEWDVLTEYVAVT